MNVDLVIEELRARCPIFNNRVGGAASLDVIKEAANLVYPSAYVIHTRDDGRELDSGNGYQQEVVVEFSVLVNVSNMIDERGQSGYATLDTIKDQLFKCLLRWKIGNADRIEFSGGELYSLDRATLAWEFKFTYVDYISLEDTRQDVDYQAMPNMTKAKIALDIIDPVADKNHPVTGKYPGPDGRIEHQMNLTLT